MNEMLNIDAWGVPQSSHPNGSLDEMLDWMVQNPHRCLASGQEVRKISVLDLRGFPISRLPANLHHLEGLEELYLSDNGLCALPKNIGALPKLKTLSLGRNQISELPESCYELWDSLVHLFLGQNHITQLPFDVSDMAYLRVGSIGSNPIPEPIGTVCWMLRADALEMPERLGYLVANAWSKAHNRTQAAFFLEQAIFLAKQMNEPMIYEAFFEGTWIDAQGHIHWNEFFSPKAEHMQRQRRQLGLSLLPYMTRGACVHPSLWAQNITQLDLRTEDHLWHWALTELPLERLYLNPSVDLPEGWEPEAEAGVYIPKSKSIS